MWKFGDIMKIGVLSDLHLGNKQYGLIEREHDFYEHYYKCMNELSSCDIVIIAGDIFDKPTPSPESIKAFKKGLRLVDGCVCGIKGNHTMLKKKNHIAADELFDIEDYLLLSKKETNFFEFDNKKINICGIDYYGGVDYEKFLKKVEELVGVIDSDAYNILVVHEAFSEYCGYSGEPLNFKDINFGDFDLVITGHIHSKYYDKNMQPQFLQPGSIERLNTAEALDEQLNGKGVWIINIDNELNSTIEFVRIENSRKFFLGEETFSEDTPIDEMRGWFDNLQQKISEQDIPPVISYKFYNDGRYSEIKDLEDNLSDYLSLNNKYYDLGIDRQISHIVNKDGSMPSIEQVLIKKMDELEYKDSVKKLVLKLYEASKKSEENALSAKDVSSDIQKISNDFYNSEYAEISDENISSE